MGSGVELDIATAGGARHARKRKNGVVRGVVSIYVYVWSGS